LEKVCVEGVEWYDSDEWGYDYTYVRSVEMHGTDFEISKAKPDLCYTWFMTHAQYEVVLDSFEVLACVETAKHGHYKFKQDCLAAYGRVA
jgi:hypothetical protein